MCPRKALHIISEKNRLKDRLHTDDLQGQDALSLVRHPSLPTASSGTCQTSSPSSLAFAAQKALLKRLQIALGPAELTRKALALEPRLRRSTLMRDKGT